jgi:hypothetical protein
MSFSLFAEPPHPILPVSGSGSGAADIVNNYSEAQFLQFVPTQPPRQANPFAPMVISGDTSWSWSTSSPNQIRSMPSGTVFPRSGVQYQPVAVLSGKTVQVPYYLAAGSSTQKSLVNGEIDNQKRKQLRRFLNTLAPAYISSGSTHASRNQTYARYIALALDHWATFVPDYYMTEKGGPTFIQATPDYRLSRDIQRVSDHNGLAHEWEADELIAFDAIYDSPALAQLSTQKGYDVRAKIANGIFLNIGDYMVDRVPISVAINTNLSGSFTVLSKVARVLNQPDYILWMGDYLDNTFRRKLMRDGVLGEGIGYSFHYLEENREAADSTYNYFSTRPADTAALVDVRDNALFYRNLIDSGIDAWDSVRLPNGQLPSFGDTVFEGTAARNAGVSSLLPAYGHLTLGAGTSASSAVQVNQNFSDDANHMRADVTAFGLWAFGNELLGNIRYSNALPGRQFTEQILAHNAVTVNRTNMARHSWKIGADGHPFNSGNLLLYEPGNNGFAVSEIDGQRAYTNATSRYQRILILNTVDVARPYVLDVFRVAGGTVHDYTLHGSIRFDQNRETSVSMTAMSGTYPLLEGGENWSEPNDSGDTFPYYGVFRDATQGSPTGNFHVTFRDTGTANRDLRLWMTHSGSPTLYLSRSPNPTRANDSKNFYAYWRPSAIVRNRVSSGTLHSLFAGVVEPMNNGVSSIASVTRVPLSTANNEAVAIRVTHTSGRVDTYLVNLHNPRVYGNSGGAATIATSDGVYSLTGRIGYYMQNSAGNRVWTMGASSFKHPQGTYSPGTQVYSGSIIGVTRQAAGATNDALIVSGILPTGTTLRGRQLSLTFGDYQIVGSSTIQQGISEMFEIDRVEVMNGQTHVILKSDPQLSISGSTTTELVAPQRTFSGTNQYQIMTSASVVPSSADTTPPVLTLPGNMTVAATSSSGAVVNFTATATDNIDGGVPVTLSHASGSVFPIGTTNVTASATDSSGNTSNGSFTITVQQSSGGTTYTWEAEDLPRTSTGAATALQTDVNTSGGEWMALSADGTGDYVEYTLPSVPAGTYTLKMRYKGHPNRGTLQARVDGTNIGSPLDQYATTSTYPEHTFGNVTFASAGTHVVRLTVTGRNAAAGAFTLSSDNFTLVPVTVSPINVEAEDLARTSTGATTALQTDAATSGGEWMALSADGTGDYVEYTIPNVAAGSYTLKMRYKGHPNRGILQARVNGTNVGGTLDQYATTSAYPEHTFGTVTVASTGNVVIRLTVTGRNAAAGAYTLSSDTFSLIP